MQRRFQDPEFLIELERVAYHLFVARWDVTSRINRYVGILDEVAPRPGAVKRQGIALSEEDKKEFLHELDGPLYSKTRVVSLMACVCQAALVS